MRAISYKGLVGGWSKWGGRRFSALDSDNQKNDHDWYCQVCGEQYPAVLSPLKVELLEQGYIRVCGTCYFDKEWTIKIIKLDVEMSSG